MDQTGINGYFVLRNQMLNNMASSNLNRELHCSV